MDNFIKLDVAIELMASKISETTRRYELTNNNIYHEKLNDLIKQRNDIYSGDIKTIDEVINLYGNQ